METHLDNNFIPGRGLDAGGLHRYESKYLPSRNFVFEAISQDSLHAYPPVLNVCLFSVLKEPLR